MDYESDMIRPNVVATCGCAVELHDPELLVRKYAYTTSVSGYGTGHSSNFKMIVYRRQVLPALYMARISL